MLEKYDEDIKLYKQALAIQEKHGGISCNVYVAASLNCTGNILFKEKKFDPSNHASIATSLSKIGNVFYEQNKYDQSLIFTKGR